ncbi:hypothetical protein [Castellaniella sp. MT123]|uniref:hypothetical protein n=1 Tax=Castellaniella sp. MT123 TaxID=3140381 RepID=UPI0031F3BF3B
MKDYLALLGTLNQKRYALNGDCVNRAKDFTQFAQLPPSTEKSDFQGPDGKSAIPAASPDEAFTQFAQLPLSAKKVNVHAVVDLAKPGTGSVATTAVATVNDSSLRTQVRTDMAVGRSAIPRSDLARAIKWRPVADAYYRHHFGCLQCIAAGQNEHLVRCFTGMLLWDALQSSHSQDTGG